MCTWNSNRNCYCDVVGFRFSPSDDEILDYYLRHKVNGSDNLTRAIAEVDLYQCEPWELPGRSAIKSNDHVWYFFCRRDKKYSGSQRSNRLTKEGFWKPTGRDRLIHARGTKKQIGTKKSLVFHLGRVPNGVGTNWVIHEYRPFPDTATSNPRAYVVCRLEEKPVEKNSPSGKGQSGSSPASTSNNNTAHNALPERGPHLEANTGPFVGNNEMDYELALQTSMEERGLFTEDLLEDDFGGYDQNWIEELDQDINFPDELNVEQPQLDTDEKKDEFVNSFLVDGDEVMYEETVNTLQHGHRPSSSCTRVYRNDGSETENVMSNVLNQHYNSIGSWQGPKENNFNYEEVLMFDDSSDDSAAATSYKLNPYEFAQKDTSITTRTFKSQYQPRSHGALAQEGPRSIKLQCGISSKNAVSREKSNKDRGMDQEKKTKEDLSRRSSESAGSSRRGSSIFKETPQLTSTPSPPSVYLCKVILGLILFLVIFIDVVGLH